MTAKAKSSSVPEKIIEEIKKEADTLINGQNFVLSLQKIPLTLWTFYWEGGTEATIDFKEVVLDGGANLQREDIFSRLLTSLLRQNVTSEAILDDLEEEVYETAEFKEFEKRIGKLCKRIDEVEEKYNYKFEFYF